MESRRPPALTYSIPPVFDAGPKSCPFLVAPCGQQAEVGPARPPESWENSWQPKQRFRIDQVPPRLPTWASENERQKPSDILQKTQKNGFTNAVHPTSPTVGLSIPTCFALEGKRALLFVRVAAHGSAPHRAETARSGKFRATGDLRVGPR